MTVVLGSGVLVRCGCEAAMDPVCIPLGAAGDGKRWRFGHLLCFATSRGGECWSHGVMPRRAAPCVRWTGFSFASSSYRLWRWLTARPSARGYSPASKFQAPRRPFAVRARDEASWSRGRGHRACPGSFEFIRRPSALPSRRSSIHASCPREWTPGCFALLFDRCGICCARGKREEAV